ncbi:MAG: hypothetical protein V4536_02760 [Pseudomonadota bacterium]|jgi:DNA-binding NarL/FixJ family response regulator
MKKHYDNLQTIHHDSKLLFDKFANLLKQSFDPRRHAEPSTLAACIRMGSCEQNLDYLGAYCLQRIKEHGATQPPKLLTEHTSDASQTPEAIHLGVANYVLKSCRNGRLPLLI